MLFKWHFNINLKLLNIMENVNDIELQIATLEENICELQLHINEANSKGLIQECFGCGTVKEAQSQIECFVEDIAYLQADLEEVSA